MTKFTRTIPTTTYTCKVYNKLNDQIEIAEFIALGKPVTGKALSKLIENESGFSERNILFLHVIETATDNAKYECTLADFLKIAKKVEKVEKSSK